MLLRSGIALAGANLARQRDAGILTALEASTLNLGGTKLVTLSACDTGFGAIRTASACMDCAGHSSSPAPRRSS
jgi:CHAT domain-containing protein